MKKIAVYADWAGLPSAMYMGLLKAEQIRGKEILAFEYDTQWLKSGYAQQLDPDLGLFEGPQYLNNDKANFGLFSDSSPDRWGRMLMKRREAIKSREEKVEAKTLFESDFLLGVDDETRMGGMRFKLTEGGPFLSNEPSFKAPPFTSIRELEQASWRLEEDDFDNDQSKWLNMLIAPGSSLGGARPKANVIAPDEHLWIAKFPSRNDEVNSGAWEYMLSKMANKLGIRTPEVLCNQYTQKHYTFLSRRFDRDENNKRIHFASAMTLLGYRDGHDFLEGGSYIELVEFIESRGADPQNDIQELWKRIVFSVLVSNTDDHLRNHGFLLKPQGWKLSPAYDINPNPYGQGLSLNISENDNSLSTALCLEVAPIFRWNASEASSFIQYAIDIIGPWEQMASQLKISQSERAEMRPAFRLPN
ncbi:MAG: HipA domain-containing protein [Bacteroidia bacterium]